MAITMGTNTPLTLSASLAIGAFVAAAVSTSLIIFERAVSSPTFSALTFKTPFAFIPPLVTAEPVSLKTGMLSPVIADSSTELSPEITIPSTGTRAPGLITTVSPFFSCEDGISFIVPFSSMITVSGTKSIRASIAVVVLLFALVSMYLPSVTNVKIIAADSKYKCALFPSSATLKIKDDKTPMAISESIVGAPLNNFTMPFLNIPKLTHITGSVRKSCKIPFIFML